MSHKLFCLFLCFLAFTKNAIASADHSLATAEEVITSEVSPSTMVNDTVNVIEGLKEAFSLVVLTSMYPDKSLCTSCIFTQ
jgi:hypothetical protein